MDDGIYADVMMTIKHYGYASEEANFIFSNYTEEGESTTFMDLTSFSCFVADNLQIAPRIIRLDNLIINDELMEVINSLSDSKLLIFLFISSLEHSANISCVARFLSL